VFGGGPDGTRPLGIRTHRWDENIKIHLQEVRCGVLDWIVVGQVRDSWRALVNAVMNLRLV